MKYSKPEVNLLDEADTVIRGIGKGVPNLLEFIDGLFDFTPAYDLDE